jgi:hypothetical protein
MRQSGLRLNRFKNLFHIPKTFGITHSRLRTLFERHLCSRVFTFDRSLLISPPTATSIIIIIIGGSSLSVACDLTFAGTTQLTGI